MQAIGSESNLVSRRGFMKQAGASVAAATATSIPDLSGQAKKLAAQEQTKTKDPLSAPVRSPFDDIEPIEKKAFSLADKIGYEGPSPSVEKIIGYDIVWKLLAEFKNHQEWDSKTFTAPLPDDGRKYNGIGYIGNVTDLALGNRIRDNQVPFYRSNFILFNKFRDSKSSASLPEIENFANTIKSGRLASMISCATLAGYPIQDVDLAKRAVAANGEIKLSLVAQKANEILGEDYELCTAAFIAPEDKVKNRLEAQNMENKVMRDLYGTKIADTLIKASRNDNPGRENEAFPSNKGGWMHAFAKKEFATKD